MKPFQRTICLLLLWFLLASVLPVLLSKVVLEKDSFCLKSLTAYSPPKITIGCLWQFHLLAVQMTIMSLEGRKKKRLWRKIRVNELFRANFIKMFVRCICTQLWEREREAKQLLSRQLYKTGVWSHLMQTIDDMQHWELKGTK